MKECGRTVPSFPFSPCTRSCFCLHFGFGWSLCADKCSCRVSYPVPMTGPGRRKCEAETLGEMNRQGSRSSFRCPGQHLTVTDPGGGVGCGAAGTLLCGQWKCTQGLSPWKRARQFPTQLTVQWLCDPQYHSQVFIREEDMLNINGSLIHSHPKPDKTLEPMKEYVSHIHIYAYKMESFATLKENKGYKQRCA